MKKTFNCLVIEPNPDDCAHICGLIRQVSNLYLLPSCDTQIKAIDILQQHEVDLVILNIEIPDLQVIQKLQDMDCPPKVIFVTSSKEYAVEAFDLGGIDCLLKPLKIGRFLKAIRKLEQLETTTSQIRNQIKPESTFAADHIFIKVDRKIVKLRLGDILFIESLKDYVIIHIPGKRLITKQKISYLEERLPTNKFLRVHRSYLISMAKIESIGNNMVSIGNKQIPVGRSYKKVVQESLALG